MSARAETFRTTAGRFAPGQSGNPDGRPKGSRNKATLVAEALLDEATGPVVAKAIDGALAGDGPILRTVFQAICRKDPGRTIELDLPEGRFGDPVAFLEATMRAVALGEITPQEAALLARVASVMVQAQRLKLRIDQQKEKSVMAGPDPAIHESGRTIKRSRKPVSPNRRRGWPGHAGTSPAMTEGRETRTCFQPVFASVREGPDRACIFHRRRTAAASASGRRCLYRPCIFARRRAEESGVTPGC